MLINTIRENLNTSRRNKSKTYALLYRWQSFHWFLGKLYEQENSYLVTYATVMHLAILSSFPVVLTPIPSLDVDS